MDPSRISQVKHLYEVERLSMRQIARELRMCQKTVSRIITGKKRPKKAHQPRVLAPYLGLIEEWYRKTPPLKATQVYEHLRDYGYTGKYTAVSTYTRPFRRRRVSYHELEFLPGAVAQVDWMEANLSLRQGLRLRLHPRLVEISLREVLSPLVHGVLFGRPHRSLQGDQGGGTGELVR